MILPHRIRVPCAVLLAAVLAWGLAVLPSATAAAAPASGASSGQVTPPGPTGAPRTSAEALTRLRSLNLETATVSTQYQAERVLLGRWTVKARTASVRARYAQVALARSSAKVAHAISAIYMSEPLSGALIVYSGGTQEDILDQLDVYDIVTKRREATVEAAHQVEVAATRAQAAATAAVDAVTVLVNDLRVRLNGLIRQAAQMKVLLARLSATERARFLAEQAAAAAPQAQPVDLSSTGGTAPATGAVGLIGSNRALMQALAAPYGWSSGAEWQSLDNLELSEAGYDQYARNPSSGAYGLAQALPETRYPPAGQESGGSDPGVQIRWMLTYIQQRYGDPIAAWQFHLANGWY